MLHQIQVFMHLSKNTLSFTFKLSFIILWLSTSIHVAVARPIESIMLNSCNELLAIPEKSTLHYQLNQDLDCTDHVIEKPKVFSGILDGQDYKISHLTLRVNQGVYAGLFSRIQGAIVKNLTFENIKWQTGESLIQLGGLLAGEIKLSHVEHIRITQSHLSAGNATHYPFAQLGLGLLAGQIDRSTLSHIQLDDNQIITTSSSSAIGGLAGRAYRKTRINKVSINGLDIRVHIGLRVRQKHNLGGVLGYLGDASLLSNLYLTHIHIDDAQNGDHAAGIGHLVGYLRPYAQVTHAVLSENHYDFIPINNHKTAFIAGKSLLHSKISHICIVPSRPKSALKYGRGQTKHIQFDPSCAHKSIESSFRIDEENKFSFKS